MKKLLLFITLFLFVGLDAAVSQSVTVRFTARNSNGGYQSFDSVIVENLQQGWNQRIAYPDTVLYLGNDNNSINLPSDAMETGLKVYPNPFAGHTETLFDLVESGTVNIRLLRINGTLIAYHSGHYAAGSYRIGITLAEPQVAFLSVEASGQRCIAKLVNRAGGNENSIVMTATASHNSTVTKAVGVGPFSVGDQMRYIAILRQGDSRSVSTSVTQYQTYSELITLIFENGSSTVTLPTVTTSSVSSVTSSTATCGGNVSDDGNATVTARGVCWSTVHYPTVSGSHSTDGSGTGSFTSGLTDLSANTTYYVRAYATNSAGTAYGSEVSFTTSSNVTSPTVTTSSVSSITTSTATCGGNVSDDGGATVTARGVCWSTSQNPTVSGSHTTDGTGTGNFTSNLTGLSANTTYYVRAYATNSAGTAYGSEVSFTTSGQPSVVGFDENGASDAVFTVSSSGQTVRFSRGNLQYTTTGTHTVSEGGTATGTWRFAEHQYDYIGADNANISSTYSGWIDLFCWGTSGWNSGVTCYQPWSSSTDWNNFYLNGSYLSLMYSYANADWGVYNAISNGGNQAGMWRTLTENEWTYLLNTRSASTVDGVANARYAMATVVGVAGLIVFPDTFTLPAGLTVINVNTANVSYLNNTYTDSQWIQMEAAGCIFLPAAGERSGTNVEGGNIAGCYWSSTSPYFGSSDNLHAYNGYVAYLVVFKSWVSLDGNQVGILNTKYDMRYGGIAVRLVKDY